MSADGFTRKLLQRLGSVETGRRSEEEARKERFWWVNNIYRDARDKGAFHDWFRSDQRRKITQILGLIAIIPLYKLIGVPLKIAYVVGTIGGSIYYIWRTKKYYANKKAPRHFD